MASPLVRVAAWRQYHAVAPIPNATAPLGINADPPDAEIAILFRWSSIGRDTLATMPQFLAECSLLVSVFGIARRSASQELRPPSPHFLPARFREIALQSATTQNDLVVGALVAAAAFFVSREQSNRHRPRRACRRARARHEAHNAFCSSRARPARVRRRRRPAHRDGGRLVSPRPRGIRGFIYFRSSGDVSTLAVPRRAHRREPARSGRSPRCSTPFPRPRDVVRLPRLLGIPFPLDDTTAMLVLLFFRAIGRDRGRAQVDGVDRVGGGGTRDRVLAVARGTSGCSRSSTSP